MRILLAFSTTPVEARRSGQAARRSFSSPTSGAGGPVCARATQWRDRDRSLRDRYSCSPVSFPRSFRKGSMLIAWRRAHSSLSLGSAPRLHAQTESRDVVSANAGDGSLSNTAEGTPARPTLRPSPVSWCRTRRSVCAETPGQLWRTQVVSSAGTRNIDATLLLPPAGVCGHWTPRP